MLSFPGSAIDLKERSPVSLAFVGDSVLELLARARLVGETRLGPGALHRQAVGLVSAKAQFAALAQLEPLLREEELNVVRRGRNANKASVSKNATPQEYRASTGLEALFGWLYLQNDQARIEALFDVIWQHYEEEKARRAQNNA